MTSAAEAEDAATSVADETEAAEEAGEAAATSACEHRRRRAASSAAERRRRVAPIEAADVAGRRTSCRTAGEAAAADVGTAVPVADAVVVRSEGEEDAVACAAGIPDALVIDGDTRLTHEHRNLADGVDLVERTVVRRRTLSFARKHCKRNGEENARSAKEANVRGARNAASSDKSGVGRSRQREATRGRCRWTEEAKGQSASCKALLV